MRTGINGIRKMNPAACPGIAGTFSKSSEMRNVMQKTEMMFSQRTQKKQGYAAVPYVHCEARKIVTTDAKINSRSD
jgi:hypothetical protein